jgi:hypothetical protein
MRVTVKLLGVLGPGDRRRLGRPFDLELRDGVTAGELLIALAKRCGAPFRQAIESPDSRLPRHIRMFVDGEMLVTREQTLAPEGGLADGVTVVLLTPMMGG